MSTLIERLRLAVRDMGDIPPERWTDAGRAARVCVVLDEAIDSLRVDHDRQTKDSGSPGDCDVVSGTPGFGGVVRCSCGADAYNATLDRLRAMLEEIDS